MSEEQFLEISQKIRALQHKKHNALQRAGKAKRLYESAQQNLIIAKERVETANQNYESICAQIAELTPTYRAVYNAVCKADRLTAKEKHMIEQPRFFGMTVVFMPPENDYNTISHTVKLK